MTSYIRLTIPTNISVIKRGMKMAKKVVTTPSLLSKLNPKNLYNKIINNYWKKPVKDKNDYLTLPNPAATSTLPVDINNIYKSTHTYSLFSIYDTMVTFIKSLYIGKRPPDTAAVVTIDNNNIIEQGVTADKYVTISGLCTFDKAILSKITADAKFKTDITKALVLIHAKMLYYFFSDKHMADNMYDKIRNCLLILNNNNNILTNPDVNKYINDHWVSINQHFINFTFIGTLLPIQPLKDFFATISFDSYEKKIYIGLWVEMVIADLAINIKNTDFDANIEAINNDNTMIAEPSSLYKTSNSIDQTGQMFSDLLFNKYEIGDNGVGVTSLHKDVKADFISAVKGHIIVKPFLYSDKKAFFQYVNIATSLLNEKISVIKDNEPLKILLANIKNIKDSTMTLKEKVIQINNLLITASLHRIFIDNGLNFTVIGDSGEADIDFVKAVLPLIEENIETTSNNININDYITNTSTLDINNTIKAIFNSIKVFPPAMQEKILDNYKKTIKFIDHD